MRYIIIAIALLMMLSAQAQRRKAAPEPAPETVEAEVVVALDCYDVATAEEQLDKYDGLRAADEATSDRLHSRLDNLRSLMERVQKVAVIDSITTDKASFFTAYNLDPSAGTLSDYRSLPSVDFPTAKETVVYSTECQNRMLWGAADSTGRISIVEANLLADGSWEKPHTLDDNINTPGAQRIDFPFVMADGVTLYFASDDPATTLGGLDIYMSRFDGERYLEPQNLGMPFNSSANDYMMAIDEATGVGLWATDRNAPEGKVTIYVFIPEETRRNYPVDTPNLASLAQLRSVAETQSEGSNYASLIAKIRTPRKELSKRTADFEIALPNGQIVYRLDELSNETSRYAMEAYLDKTNELTAAESELAALRKAYRDGDKSTATDILKLEEMLPQLRTDCRRLLNITIETEMRYRQ